MKGSRLRSLGVVWGLGLLGVALSTPPARAQFGTIIAGAGPVNRSVAGVATAMPLSAAGAMMWNPATLPGLGRSQLEASAELLWTHTSVASSVPASAFGPGVPPFPLSGRSGSDSDLFPLPTIGLAYLPEDSPFSFGLGVFALAGFGVDYPGSTTNPLLTPTPPVGVGLNPVYSEFQALQIVPAAAYKLTDRLSLAAGPTLMLATLRVDPGLFAAPDDANGNGFATYPRASHGRTVWGGGFMAGVFYQADTWAVGASIKSPQWLDKFRFNSADELGRPRQLSLNADLPMIVSVGASYTGLEDWVFGVDVRWLDYATTDGFGEGGVNPDGSVRGVDWKSIWAVAVGAQYRVSDALSVRLGYSWAENPIPARQSMINTVTPTMIEHMVTLGVSWDVTDSFSLSAAYVRAFENSINGPLLTLAGPVPGSSVRNTAAADSVVIGASVKFGGPCR